MIEYLYYFSIYDYSMHVLPRTQLGNPVLRQKAKKVTLEQMNSVQLQKLIQQMFYTCTKAHGVGLAAPQVDQSIQLAVIDIHPTDFRPSLSLQQKIVIMNPQIIEYSKKTDTDWEGCLSFNSIRGKVRRSTSITVEYYDEQGAQQQKKITGFAARVFQHEIDHLNGIVYIDRMENMSTLMTTDEFQQRVLS